MQVPTKDKMNQWTWRSNAASACCMGALREGDETSELFAKPWRGRASPLFWRIPILLWSLLIIGWSGAGFWGPPEMFFLYMTHWGLLLIMVESLFGVIVTIRKHNGGLPGHTSPSDFYVSCWQSSRSAAPLLSLRCFLFLYSLSTLVTSMILTPMTSEISVGFWFIYLTHWAFLLIVLTTGSSVAVSACVYFDEPIDATFGLPWYVKTYWVLYNVTIPVAFLITVFYWGVLKTATDRVVNYAPNPVLDVMLHGVNSLVMLAELLASAHPSRLLHVMQPLYFALAYLLFSVGYYSVGGLDPWGNTFIYPVIDWSKPQQTMVVVTLTALFLALMHILTVGIATVRDMIARKYFRDSTGVCNDGFKA